MLGLAERDQQLAALLSPSRRGTGSGRGVIEAQRVESRAQVRDGIFVGVQAAGALRRAGGIRHRPPVRVHRGSLQEMVRQLCHGRVDLIGVRRLENLADLRMQPRPCRRADLRIERLANEGMREAIAVGGEG